MSMKLIFGGFVVLMSRRNMSFKLHLEVVQPVILFKSRIFHGVGGKWIRSLS